MSLREVKLKDRQNRGHPCHRFAPPLENFLLQPCFPWEEPATLPSPPGAERDPRLPSLPHEAGPARPSPGGPAPRWPVWERRVLVRARLFHPAEASENHRGGAGHHCHASRVRDHGAGGLWGVRGEASQLRTIKSSQESKLPKWGGCPRGDQLAWGGPSWRWFQPHTGLLEYDLRGPKVVYTQQVLSLPLVRELVRFPRENRWKPLAHLRLSAVCRAPGQDRGLRECGDRWIPLQPGWQLPLLGAESPPAGGTSLHGNDRRCQPAGRPATGKEMGSEPWGFFCPEWGSPVLLRLDLPARLLAGVLGSDCFNV